MEFSRLKSWSRDQFLQFLVSVLVLNLRVFEGVQLLSDELSEVSDNLKLTVQFLSDDFAAVSELSGCLLYTSDAADE